METLVVIILLIIIYLVIKSSSRAGTTSKPANTSRKSASPKNTATKQTSENWLKDRWELAQKQKLSGGDGIFPEWYFDTATEPQLKKLDELELSFNSKKITKGQASDLIGMQEPAEEESLKILKFFKISTRGIRQTQARHEIALLFKDEEKVQAWEARPPSALQKEFFKFFGIKLAKGTTQNQAEKIIRKNESEMADEDNPRLEEWEAYEQIIDEFSDSDFREDYEIKKPSFTLIRKAMEELQKDGKTYQDISEDLDILVEKLIELKPELQRE